MHTLSPLFSLEALSVLSLFQVFVTPVASMKFMEGAVESEVGTAITLGIRLFTKTGEPFSNCTYVTPS